MVLLPVDGSTVKSAPRLLVPAPRSITRISPEVSRATPDGKDPNAPCAALPKSLIMALLPLDGSTVKRAPRELVPALVSITRISPEVSRATPNGLNPNAPCAALPKSLIMALLPLDGSTVKRAPRDLFQHSVYYQDLARSIEGYTKWAKS